MTDGQIRIITVTVLNSVAADDLYLWSVMLYENVVIKWRSKNFAGASITICLYG